MTDPDLIIAKNFKGKIPQIYSVDQINNLTQDELSQFGNVLGVPDIDRPKLIRVLTHLGAMNKSNGFYIPENERLFAISEEDYINLYSFDINSTPYSDLIISKFDEFREQEKRDDQHHTSRLGGSIRSSELLYNILQMANNFVSGGWSRDPNMTREVLVEISEILGQPITREQLGEWKQINTPYKNIRIGFAG